MIAAVNMPTKFGYLNFKPFRLGQKKTPPPTQSFTARHTRRRPVPVLFLALGLLFGTAVYQQKRNAAEVTRLDVADKQAHMELDELYKEYSANTYWNSNGNNLSPKKPRDLVLMEQDTPEGRAAKANYLLKEKDMLLQALSAREKAIPRVSRYQHTDLADWHKDATRAKTAVKNLEQTSAKSTEELIYMLETTNGALHRAAFVPPREKPFTPFENAIDWASRNLQVTNPSGTRRIGFPSIPSRIGPTDYGERVFQQSGRLHPSVMTDHGKCFDLKKK